MSQVQFQSAVRSCVRPLVLCVLLALPAILVIDDVRRGPGLLWGASIALTCLFILSLEGNTRPARLIGAGIAGLFAFLNMALALSFIVQGTAFNTAFFSHLDTSTLAIALRTDGLRMILASAYILGTPFVAYWACAQPSWPSSWLKRTPVILKVAVLGGAAWTSYPATSIVQHYLNTTQSSARLLAEIAELRSLPASQTVLSGENTKNLVLIYLESVEANYLDPDLFPALTPNLNNLANEGLWFRNIHQFPGTGWTVGGMVSSHCGVPLLSDRNGNMILVEVDNPFAQITCMPEYLEEAGYRSAFIGGASLDFAGKGNFLRDNGYDLALGIDELPNATAHKWGMFDDDMFTHATELFDGLAQGNDPFLLSILTLDTHHPFGTPSPSCANYQNSTDTMLNAVHCADQLIKNFVSHIRASPVADDTVIFIMSDHLLIQGSTKDQLAAQDRRILAIMLDPDAPVQQMTGAATHFDIAPTLLEALGFSQAQFAFGQSLLSHSQGRAFERNLSEADFQPFKIERLTERENK